ncbi:hypothetical protein BC567DRAFT_66055 [Phyllosticta citribraziliensis]
MLVDFSPLSPRRRASWTNCMYMRLCNVKRQPRRQHSESRPAVPVSRRTKRLASPSQASQVQPPRLSAVRACKVSTANIHQRNVAIRHRPKPRVSGGQPRGTPTTWGQAGVNTKQLIIIIISIVISAIQAPHLHVAARTSAALVPSLRYHQRHCSGRRRRTVPPVRPSGQHSTSFRLVMAQKYYPSSATSRHVV